MVRSRPDERKGLNPVVEMTPASQQRSVLRYELLGSERDAVETFESPSSREPVKLSAFSSLLLVSESITRGSYSSVHEKDAKALYDSMTVWAESLADPDDKEAITDGLDLVRIEGQSSAGIDRKHMTQLLPEDLETVAKATKALEKYWLRSGAGVAKLYRCFYDVERELRDAVSGQNMQNTSIPERYKQMTLPIRPGNHYPTYSSSPSGQFN